jgi:hypothetical protein
MHIHINRSAFADEKHLGKFLVFINKAGNEKLVTTVAQRKSTQWARLDPKKKVTDTKDMVGRRYEAVNLQNTNTIEMRIFRGTVRKDRFFKNLEFADAALHFTQNQPETRLGYPNFIEWLETKSDHYPYLVSFLKEKEFINA